jgi:hypothetical protein
MAGSGGSEIPGTSHDGMAGHQYRAVRLSIDATGVSIDSTRRTREYGKESVEGADKIGMTGMYRASSEKVAKTADDAVKALIAARAKLEDLAAALLEQGA